MCKADLRCTPDALSHVLSALPSTYQVVGSREDPDYVTLVIESDLLRPETRAVTLISRTEGSRTVTEVLPLH